MTEEEILSKLSTENERQEFRCAKNLYSFAYLAIHSYYGRKWTDEQQRELSVGPYVAAYFANLRWLGDILFERFGRPVSRDEIVERWRNYYIRLVERGVIPAMTYDNGLQKNAPISFKVFNDLIFLWRENIRAHYAQLRHRE